MALVSRFGIPDIFLTYICNPKSSEILHVIGDQQYQGRPDIVVRSFQMRVDDLIDRVCKKGLLGKISYWFYAVEFQKISLPHIHMCLKFAGSSSVSSVRDIDRLISAELPDMSLEPVLFETVANNMVHGPCNSNCLVNGVCRKSFQKLIPTRHASLLMIILSIEEEKSHQLNTMASI